jgi:hypothetical protein
MMEARGVNEIRETLNRESLAIRLVVHAGWIRVTL